MTAYIIKEKICIPYPHPKHIVIIQCVMVLQLNESLDHAFYCASRYLQFVGGNDNISMEKYFISTYITSTNTISLCCVMHLYLAFGDPGMCILFLYSKMFTVMLRYTEHNE